MFPAPGGDYVFLRERFGKRIAFLPGWISLWVGFSAPSAAASIAFGSYFSSAFQLPGMSKILAVTVIARFTFVHSQSLSFGSRLNNFATLIKIFIIIMFVGIGLTLGNGSIYNFSGQLRWAHMFSQNFSTSLIFVSFAYSGVYGVCLNALYYKEYFWLI
jgi:APA family basic amino acid/polyamine antiporter